MSEANNETVGASAVLADGVAAGGVAPPPAAAPSLTWPAGLPVTPPAFYEQEAVASRAEIEQLKSDKDFYKSLVAERERGESGPATQRWANLHRVGFPPPAAIQSQDDVNRQAAAINQTRWDEYIASLRQHVSLTTEQEQEIRGGVVNDGVRAWAAAEKQRLIRDEGWRQRYFRADREAVREWSLVVAILGLRPVPWATDPRAKRG
jgi:hypothetical protein